MAAAATLLSGCAASSFSETDGEDKIALNAGAIKQDVTASVTPTSFDAAAEGPQPGDGKSAGGKSARSKAAQIAAAVSAVGTPGSAAYKIGPQDVIEVTVFKVSELSKTAQVSEAGTINYPLVGDVVAAGRTPREVERDLTALLGTRYLQNPQVSVYVKEFNSQRITVEGAVRRPGVFPIQGQMSLLQAVAMAQGMDGSISDDTVLIFRQANGKRSAARFDISDIRTGDADDPQLQPGDVVVAGTSAIKEGFGNIMKVLPVTSAFAFL